MWHILSWKSVTFLLVLREFHQLIASNLSTWIGWRYHYHKLRHCFFSIFSVFSNIWNAFANNFLYCESEFNKLTICEKLPFISIALVMGIMGRFKWSVVVKHKRDWIQILNCWWVSWVPVCPFYALLPCDHGV
jgi:uncharacterized membrane protein YsdA (DUF1294 family)